jgi:drug/metabolite transporter (DMT)-like permease
MSLVAPVTAAGTVIPVVAGMVEGEQLTVVKLAGIAVTLAGILLASGPEFRSGVPVRRQAIGFAIGAAVGFGLAYTLLASAAGTSVYGTLLCQRIGGLVVPGPIVARTRILRELQVTARTVGALALVGGCDTTANGTYALATSRGNLSVAAVLASLYPVVTALLARSILAERLRTVQTIGVLAALCGVVLLGS